MTIVKRKGDNYQASATVLGKTVVGDLGPTKAWALRHLEYGLRNTYQAVMEAREDEESREFR